jgi:hypothetical protein
MFETAIPEFPKDEAKAIVGDLKDIVKDFTAELATAAKATRKKGGDKAAAAYRDTLAKAIPGVIAKLQKAHAKVS